MTDVAPAIDIRDIPGGDAGVFATLGVMRQLARRASQSFAIRAIAVEWTAGALTPRARALAIRSELARAFVYRDDPTAETIYAPEFLAREWSTSRTVTGDCDDLSTFGAALALAVGLSCVFVVISCEAGGAFGHVYTEIRPTGVNPRGLCTFDAAVSDGVDLDLQRPAGPVRVTRLACVRV